MQLKILDERNGNTNYVTSNIIECVYFWHKQGKNVYEKNQNGILGNKETNELSRNKVYDDFILDMLLVDCNTFIKSEEAIKSGIKYTCGRTRSHVWVHENNDRKLMIYFE